MIYQHRYEARIGAVILDAYDVVATITAARCNGPDWMVSKIEAEGVREIFDGYGLPDFRNEWVVVPPGSPLHLLIIRDIYDNCRSDIDEAWRLQQAERVPA